MAASPLAAGVGPGGAGFLVVVVLIVAVVAILVAMAGSLRRLRQSVAKGAFGQPGESSGTAAGREGDAAAAEGAPASRTEASADNAVTRDPGDRDGAGA
jgi:hypothetical protein